MRDFFYYTQLALEAIVGVFGVRAWSAQTGSIDRVVERPLSDDSFYLALRGLLEAQRPRGRCRPGRSGADVAERAHALMEECLIRVLEIEGWDPVSLTMPESLKKKPAKIL